MPRRGREILTLQKVGCQQRRRGVRAGQTLLQEVSLKLQGKQVSRRELKTPQASTPEALEHTPHASLAGEHRAPGKSSGQTRQSRREQTGAEAKQQEARAGSSAGGVTHSRRTRLPDTPRLQGGAHRFTLLLLYTQNCTLRKSRNIQSRFNFKRSYDSFRQTEDFGLG